MVGSSAHLTSNGISSECDLQSAVVAEDVDNAVSDETPRPSRRELFRHFAETQAHHRQQSYLRGLESRKAFNRNMYRKAKAEKGEEVRSYVRRDIQQGQFEGGEDFLRRKDRKYKRDAYHEIAQNEGRDVRHYTDLSEMTDEEFKAYKREQNKLNKRLNRAKKKAFQAQESLGDPSGNA